MPTTTKLTPGKLLVKKVEGGYQVHKVLDDGTLEPINNKVYFHPTSAYAAMGREVHKLNTASLKLDVDPAKAPAKEPAK
jgi:hypothetical protein